MKQRIRALRSFRNRQPSKKWYFGVLSLAPATQISMKRRFGSEKQQESFSFFSANDRRRVKSCLAYHSIAAIVMNGLQGVGT